MNSAKFVELIEFGFKPFLDNLGFEKESIHCSGRYYRAGFENETHRLIVSFEPGDDYISGMLVSKTDDDLKSIDDPEKTPRFSDLNSTYMKQISSSVRMENDAFFSGIEADDGPEKKLLNCAKDLRLVLPLFLKQKAEN